MELPSHTYISMEIFHWGGVKPKILEGGEGREIKFSKGGIEQGESFFWLNFSKILRRVDMPVDYK